jgi:glycosyltransferase involved in cell wall biosynthesis
VNAPVSVILPAFNGERFIRAAIESVRAQTLPVSEIIVVDDGSGDRTPDIARQLGVRVIARTHHGVSASRNAGIRAAACDWVGFIDQDDLWEPQKIAHQWAAIQRHPDSAVVSCHLRYVADESSGVKPSELDAAQFPAEDNDGRIAYFRHIADQLPFNRMFDYTSSLLVRRDVLLAVGMFDESLSQNEDLECFLRVVARSPLAVARRPLVHRRIHDTNTALRDPKGALAAYRKVLGLLGSYPDRYPPGAACAYGIPFARGQISAGLARLESGRPVEARAFFRHALAVAFSNRAILLYCLSFLAPAVARRVLSLGRTILKSGKS